MKKDFKLCYIEYNFAYFTTQKLKNQWGDDWNDAPYEHNAETPYEPRKEGENWEICKIGFDGDWVQPSEFSSKAYSVEEINKKTVPWLKKWEWDNENGIYAGCSLEEFIERILQAGDNVYTLYAKEKS